MELTPDQIIEQTELAIDVMKSRGYTNTAKGNKETTLFFLKKVDTTGLTLHAMVYLNRNSVTLDILGELDYGISLRSMDMPLDSTLFDKSEESLLTYINLLLHGVLKEKKEKVEKSLDDRKTELWDEIREVAKKKNYEKEMCLLFYKYWTAKNGGGKLMEFEKERTFDVGRRLTTWLMNDKKWKARYESREEKKAEQQNRELAETGTKHIKHSDLF